MKNVQLKFWIYTFALLGLWFSIISIESCTWNENGRLTKKITEQEILNAQKSWETSFLTISGAFRSKIDVKPAAESFISKHYGFDEGEVLFKPTTAYEDPFRTNFEGAMSYFIGNNPNFPADEGFALQDWADIHWINEGIINNHSDIATAMGSYVFKNRDGDEFRADFTMVFKKMEDGQIKLVAHKSAVPYKNS